MCKIIVWKVLFPLLFLHNFLAHLHAQIAQQSIQSVDWYNIHSVLNSIGQWQLQVPEQFVRNKMMPFIQQFRRQLNPMTEIISMPAQQNGGISSAYQLNPNNPNQVARFSHVDLNPPEQRTYRNGPASTRGDLAGMIVREMWRKAKTHCVQCSSTGSRGQCELVNPGCGYPYQLFDDQARQIHCTVILRKESGRTQLHAQMECNTLPATPSLVGSVLATNYQRNWRWMCVNCTPSVGQRNVLRVWTDRKYSRIYQISNAEGRDIARFINRVRAEIARGEALNLPVAAAMNQIKWKPSLASEAQRQLYSRDNDAVNIIDLEFTLLIPNARRGGRPEEDKTGKSHLD